MVSKVRVVTMQNEKKESEAKELLLFGVIMLGLVGFAIFIR
jgi:hypothetical protein